MIQQIGFSIAIVVFLCGCASHKQPDSSPQPLLERGQILYIAVPKDVPDFDDGPGGGIIDDKRYPETGSQLASMLKGTLAPYASDVFVAANYESDAAAIESGKSKNARYVVIPFFNIRMKRRIMWEPRVYEFSLIIRTFDLKTESKSPIRSVGMKIYKKNSIPRAQTKQEVKELFHDILPDYANIVYEAKKPKAE